MSHATGNVKRRLYFIQPVNICVKTFFITYEILWRLLVLTAINLKPFLTAFVHWLFPSHLVWEKCRRWEWRESICVRFLQRGRLWLSQQATFNQLSRTIVSSQFETRFHKNRGPLTGPYITEWEQTKTSFPVTNYKLEKIENALFSATQCIVYWRRQ